MRGKLFRPTLLLLASSVEGTPEDRALPLAAVSELVHLTSVVHDDSVDHSVLRRGQPTLNAIFSHQVAVLMGDFLFSKAIAELQADTSQSIQDKQGAISTLIAGIQSSTSPTLQDKQDETTKLIQFGQQSLSKYLGDLQADDACDGWNRRRDQQDAHEDHGADEVTGLHTDGEQYGIHSPGRRRHGDRERVDRGRCEIGRAHV